MSKRNTNKARNWAITFPQTTCERKEFVNSFPPYEEVICAKEAHEDGGYHLHMGIKLKKGITKRKMLDWIEAKHPDDFKRIDVQGTRSITQWTDYICKEDPGAYKDVNASVREARDAKMMEKVKELSKRAREGRISDIQIADKQTYSRIWGAVKDKKIREQWCKGCNTVCPECETLWREYWKKLEKTREQD